MGKRWRCFNERFRQQIARPMFIAANVEANRHLYNEVAVYRNFFSGVVPKLHTLVKSYKSFNDSIVAILEFRVPSSGHRVFRSRTFNSKQSNVDEDAVTEREREIVGSSSDAMERRMKDDVLAVFQNWFTRFEKCKTELRELDALKFEVDSRQRTVIALQYQIQRQTETMQLGKIERNGARIAIEAQLNHKQEKHNASKDEFQNKNRELEMALNDLRRDVHPLTRQITNIYGILSEVPGSVHEVLEERQQ
eukprot:g1449.t1